MIDSACAITCTISVLPTSDCSSYGVSNLTCLCTSTNFQNQYLTCQTKTCNSVDLTAAEKFGVESCASIGHPITIANNTSKRLSVSLQSSVLKLFSPHPPYFRQKAPTSSSPSASSASPITTASGTMAPITSATTKPSAGNKKNEVALGLMGMMILAGVGLIL